MTTLTIGKGISKYLSETNTVVFRLETRVFQNGKIKQFIREVRK